MTDEHVRRAYSARATEYTSILGSIEDMHGLDQEHIASWAKDVNGPIVDAGCGPGHWTDFLYRRGAEISGLDLVEEFVAEARIRFPNSRFHLASLRSMGFGDKSIQGVLAWYSLIHVPPLDLPDVLAEFARVLGPQGHLLIGMFRGDSGRSFDHAVSPAYLWSVEHMSRLLQEAGFDIVGVQTRCDPGQRPHAAISAIRRSL